MKIKGSNWVNNLTGIRIYQQEYKGFFAYLAKNKRKLPNGVLTKKQNACPFYCEVSTSAFNPISTNCMGGFRHYIKNGEKELN